MRKNNIVIFTAIEHAQEDTNVNSERTYDKTEV